LALMDLSTEALNTKQHKIDLKSNLIKIRKKLYESN